MHITHLAYKTCSANGSYYSISSHLIIKQVLLLWEAHLFSLWVYMSLCQAPGSHGQVGHKGVCLPHRGLVHPRAPGSAPLLGLPRLTLLWSPAMYSREPWEHKGPSHLLETSSVLSSFPLFSVLSSIPAHQHTQMHT